MRKHIALLIAGLILQPTLAHATACGLDRAIFRPKYAPERFVIRGLRSGNNPVFDLAISRTNETFRFRVDVDRTTGAGTLTSVPGPAGPDPGIKASFQLLVGRGLKTAPTDAIGYVSFHELERAFVDFRMRRGGTQSLTHRRRRACGRSQSVDRMSGNKPVVVFRLPS
jgi:hypothetical protein